MSSTLALGMPMGAEWIVIAALGLLLFGKRLPEVGRSLGRGIVEFKKGIKGVEDDVETQVDVETKEATARPRLTDQSAAVVEKTDHKFDPYTGEPIAKPAPKFDPYTGKPIEDATAASHSESHSA